MKSTFYEDLIARGIVKQVTDPSLGAALENERLTLYAGFDPTADSLHVGSLFPLLTLRRFQLAGHKPIALIGGATGMIGDPSGKQQERSLLNSDQIKNNLAGISSVISRFLDLSGPNPAKIVNNGDWFQDVLFIDFLRDIGKHFTVNHMIAKESVRARLEDREHGISYTEFSYMLLQAYDFLVLNRKENCRLQIGGSDQWGNITAGIELIRRIRATEPKGTELAEVYGFTHPLVIQSDGTKFGKTEKGAIWLDAKRTSPYQFYQFFMQTVDADVMNFIRYFSFLPFNEIQALEESLKREPEKRLAQTALAREVTRLVHGQTELDRAEKASRALFGTEIRELDSKTLLEVFQGAPATRKGKTLLSGSGLPLVDLLVETHLCQSKGAARKDLAAGGIYINNERISDATAVLTQKDLISNNYLILRKGKKNYHLISFD